MLYLVVVAPSRVRCLLGVGLGLELSLELRVLLGW